MPVDPDLNFPNDFHEQRERQLADARRRVEALRKPGFNGMPDERRLRWLATCEEQLRALEKAEDPAVRRTRFRQPDARYTRVIREGKGRRHAVVFQAGVVELVDPGFDYDFRIDLRWNENTASLEPRAVAVIARPDGPPVSATNLRTAQVGTAILEAVRVLSRRADLDTPGSSRRATGGDATLILRSPDDKPRASSRRTSAQVREEVERVAAAWRNAPPDVPVREFIAGKTGLRVELVKERLESARRDGLIPPAGGTTRPRR